MGHEGIMYNVCKNQMSKIKLKRGPRALLLPLLAFKKGKREAASAQNFANPKDAVRVPVKYKTKRSWPFVGFP